MEPRDLPLRPIIVDTEFQPQDDGTQVPIAVVARDGWSGEVSRRLVGNLGGSPFFPSGSDTVMVAHNAAAELETYRALGWSWPDNIIDTYAEHLRLTCGLPASALHGVLPGKRAGLLMARRCWGLPARAQEEKTWMIRLILRGPPFTREEEVEILDYCREDVDDTHDLFVVLLRRMSSRDVPGALIRGRYAKALASFTRNGMPVDLPLHDAIIAGWSDIRRAMIDSVAHYGVYVDYKFSNAAFERLLAHVGADALWPMTRGGERRSTEEKVLREMGHALTSLAPLCHAMVSLGQMKKVRPLAAGPDGRVRLGRRELAYRRLGLPQDPDDERSIGWGAFRSKTGRNQPPAKDFVLLRANWWRTLVTPPAGRALLYADWASQEIAVAGYLSGDPNMIGDYRTGDFYLTYARAEGLVPPDATKDSHGQYRNDVLKPSCLGPLYGMEEASLSVRIGCSLAEARRLLQAHRYRYAAYWAWVEGRIDVASLVGRIETPLGWQMHIGDLGRTGDAAWTTGETTIQNWSMQATGGDILRVACIALVEAGVKVVFPLHDAVCVECEEAEVEGVSHETAALMERAAESVLGAPIPVDIKVVRHGESLRGRKGDVLWSVVEPALRARGYRHREAA